MEWGIELWDQFDSVDKHHVQGIDFAEKYNKFIKERSALESEYGLKLRKLVKTYQPKKKDDDRSMFSTHKAFQSQLSELNDIAGQHEIVAEEMLSKISKPCQTLCNELRVEKKKLYQEGRHLQSTLDHEERLLEQTKKKFEKEWKECERAQAYFEKLDADGNVTKADVEKAKHAWQAKKDSVEHCKTDYGASLQQFNTNQDAHFQTQMPKIFQNYKASDQQRILKIKELMIEYAKIDSKVKPIIKKCLDGMEQAANAVDSKLDSQLVVEKLKSGFMPPSAKEFEDYTAPHQHKQNVEERTENSNRNSINLSKQPNRKSGLSWLFGAKKQKGIRKRISWSSFEGESSEDANCSQTEQYEQIKNFVYNDGDTSNANRRSKTLSLPSNQIHSIHVHSDSEISTEKRSASVNVLNESDRYHSKEQPPRKFEKWKPRLLDTNFRILLSQNRKKIKSIFKSSKDERSPAVEVTGPSSCDLLGSAVNDDYLVPITRLPPFTQDSTLENPYDEVALPPDGSDDTNMVVECPDYSHLPPEQRRKKLQKIIDGLKSDLNKEEDGRKGILKMQEVYRANPALGDAASLEPQLKISATKIEKIHAELHQHEAWYANASGSVQSSPARSTIQDTSPEKIVPAIQPIASEPEQANKILQKEQSFGDDFDDEAEAVGTCIALYDFTATSEGALSMTTGEKFSVLEIDNGDGWTRVTRDDLDGYVPTSYVEVTLFT